ncbi:hypothetical protein [Salegentibacter chungangensis]|uniref:DUF4468 domain-containing protein n=1 Tax=Salegentibacter chungangensis TaxID=1335724 RepID=A0ABW3NTC1_9FLAO
MKKLGFLLCILLVPFQLLAQEKMEAEKFQLSPEGFENYVVREYPGKTDSELFMAVKRWAEQAIANSKEAMKKHHTNQYLQYRVFVPQGIVLENDDEVYKWDVLFDVSFTFKDQHIRYDVKLMEVSSPDAPTFALNGSETQWSFFDLEGNPRKVTAEARKQVNNMANDFIRGVSSYVNMNAAEDQK